MSTQLSLHGQGQTVVPYTAVGPRPEPSVDMGDYLSVIRRRKVLIATMTLAGLCLALFYSVVVATPTYVSDAAVQVRPVAGDLAAVNVDKAVNMGTEREIARSDSVAALAKARMKSNLSLADLERRIDVSAVGVTQVLEVSCADKTKLRAQQCAQTFAESYLEFKKKDATTSCDNSRNNVQAALNAINDKINQATERLATTPVNSPQQAQVQTILRALNDEATPYRTQLAQLNSLDVNNAGSIVSPANLPASPASPKPKTNAALGAFFGFFLGLLTAFARDRVDMVTRSQGTTQATPHVGRDADAATGAMTGAATGAGVGPLPNTHRRSMPGGSCTASHGGISPASTLDRPRSLSSPKYWWTLERRRSAESRTTRLPTWARATARLAAMAVLPSSPVGLATMMVFTPCRSAMTIMRVRSAR